MSSKLKVNNIIPSTGTQIGISTTGGGINLLTGTVVTGIITASGFVGSGDLSITGDSTFTGDINVVSDVNITDWIVHTGDTDTKFGFPAVDTFTVQTAGSQRLHITSGGLVGINNGSPATVLDIKSTKASDGLTVTKGSNVAAFLGHNGTGDEGLLHLKDGGTTTIQIYGETGQTSFFNAGKVGIGTNSPSFFTHIQGDGVSNDVLKITARGSGQMVNIRNHSNVPSIVRFSNYLGNAFWDAQYNTDNSFALDYNDAEKFRITSGGLVGINTSVPTAQLSFLAKRSTQTMPPICFQTAYGAGLADAAISTTDDSGGTDIMMGSNVYMGQNGAFVRYYNSYGSAAVRCQYTGKTLFYNKSGNNAPEESMRIDGNGRLLIGATAVRDVGGLSSQTLAIEGTDGPSSSLSLIDNQNSAGGCGSLNFAKSRGTSVGSNTIVQDGDSLGAIAWCAADGNDIANQSAKISCTVDAPPGSNDTAGRLKFFTAEDGSSSPTSRLEINKDGYVYVKTGNIVMSTSGTGIDFSATSDGSGTDSSELLADYEEGTWTPVPSRYSSPQGAINCSMSTQLGRYRKIGKMVQVEFYLSISSVTSQGGSATYIAGLPYAPVSAYMGSGNLFYNSGLQHDSTSDPTFFVAPHPELSSVLYFRSELQAGHNLSSKNWRDGHVTGSCTYQTN